MTECRVRAVGHPVSGGQPECAGSAGVVELGATTRMEEAELLNKSCSDRRLRSLVPPTESGEPGCQGGRARYKG